MEKQVNELISKIMNSANLNPNDLNKIIELHEVVDKKQEKRLEMALRDKLKQINFCLSQDCLDNLINMLFYRDGKSDVVDLRLINKNEIAIIRKEKIELGDSLHDADELNAGFALREEAYLIGMSKNGNVEDCYPPEEIFSEFYKNIKNNIVDLKRKLKISDDKVKMYFDRELDYFYFVHPNSFKVILTKLPNIIKIYEVNIFEGKWIPLEVNNDYTNYDSIVNISIIQDNDDTNISIIQDNNFSINKFNQLKHNQTIMEKQRQLLSELKQTQNQLSEQQENCDHIRVCIGWNGPFLYRDTSICKCLICGKNEPESNYPLIEAYNYKSELYSHGELESYRDERMSELQNLAMNIISEKEDITIEQLIEIMNEMIKNEGKTLADISAELRDYITGSNYSVEELRRIYTKTDISDNFCMDNHSNCDTGSSYKEEQGPVKKLVSNKK